MLILSCAMRWRKCRLVTGCRVSFVSWIRLLCNILIGSESVLSDFSLQQLSLKTLASFENVVPLSAWALAILTLLYQSGARHVSCESIIASWSWA
jgi:hypothetical protein